MFNVVTNTVAIVVLCFVLIKAVSHLVTSSIRLARYLQISEYTVSFLIVALATSLPELVLGVIAAYKGDSILSLGNVLGSNIADLTLILAIPIFVGGAISTSTLIKSHDLVAGTLLSMFPILLLLDGDLTRLDGTLLMLSYLLYVLSALRAAEQRHHISFLKNELNVIKEFLILILSAGALWLSATVIVTMAERLSTVLNVPILLVGLTVTALGTSLPELAFGLKAIKTKHKGEVIGSIVGSAVANSTLILGATAVINPFNFSISGHITPYIFLLLVLLVFFIFSLTRKEIGKLEALLLCLIYSLFVLASLAFV